MSNRLKMHVMNEATVAAHILRSHVGRGSVVYYFEGDMQMAHMMSSMLTVVKVARSRVVYDVHIGGDAVAVAVRTPAIFESMKL